MAKNKILIVIFAVFMLGAAILAGCSASTGNETIPEEEAGINAPEAPYTEEKEANDNQGNENQAASAANGTLKSYDANSGTITIVDQSGEEMVLKVTDDCKVTKGTLPVKLDELADMTGYNASVEYDAEAKTATAIKILE